MAVDRDALKACLEQLDGRVPLRYAQWLVEDPLTRDYRVIAARLPDGSAGYAIAHRTGVIGQVFRTGRSIVVPDTSAHPLYDPFDADVDWELAIPVWREASLVAVPNLEGGGTYELDSRHWGIVATLVARMGWTIEPTPPDPAVVGLVSTRWVFGRARPGRAPDLLRLGARWAHRGRTVLAIGVFPDVPPSAIPTVCEADASGAPLAECVRGVGPRLDIVQLGSLTEGMRAFETHGGRSLVDGRYEFVLVTEQVGSKTG